MPELPEVETVVRGLLKNRLVGKEISRAEVFWPRTLGSMPVDTFKKRLAGKRVTAVSRRAKFIVIGLSGGATLLVHLRMTGRMDLCPGKTERNPHEHVILNFKDGTQLRFQDTRKFGRWLLTDKPDAHLAKIGPEPFSKEFTPVWFYGALQKHRRKIKPLLLDQSFVAGIGNIYADEALWRARLHPETVSNRISAKQAAVLCRAVVHVLKTGVENMGTSLGKSNTNFYSVAGRRGRNQDKLKVFRRDGEPCPRCRRILVRQTVAQRSSHFCPSCQKI